MRLIDYFDRGADLHPQRDCLHDGTRGWTILDTRGNRVDLALTDVKAGTPLAASLFKYDGPDAGQILGHGRN